MSTPSHAGLIKVVHVHLILVRGPTREFYLEIPLDIIHSLCLTPRKYLVFLGWYVPGIEGTLTQDQASEETNIQLNGDLGDQRLYYFVAPGAGKFRQHRRPTLTMSSLSQRSQSGS